MSESLNPSPDKIHVLEHIPNIPNTNAKTYKLQGINLDKKNLNLSTHVNFLIAKFSRAVFILHQVKNFLPKTTLKPLNTPYFAAYH